MDEKDLMKLDKHVILAIEWTASEYSYLEEFKEEISHLKATSRNKHLRKAAHFLRYIGKAERRAFRFEEEIGKELYEIYNELIKQADYRSEIKTIIETIRIVARELNIEKKNLTKYASWHVGTLDNDFKYLKDEGQEGGEGYNTIVKQLAVDIEIVEKWIRALEVSLQKAKELLPKLEKHESLTEGMKILKENAWKCTSTEPATIFLARHPEDLKKIVVLTGRKTSVLFHYGLPSIKNLINEEYWLGIMQIIGLVKEESNVVFQGFSKIMYLVNPTTWIDIIHIVAKTGRTSYYVFESAIPTVRKLINQKTWPKINEGLIKIALVAKRSRSEILFFEHIFVDLINIISIERWEDLVKMIQTADKKAIEFISSIIAIKDLITIETWKVLVKVVLKYKGVSSLFFFDIIFRFSLEATKDGRPFQDVESFLISIRRLNIGTLSILPKEKYLHYLTNLDEKGLKSFFKSFSQDKHYFTVQGLSTLGFLSCHVTNAFGGGAALNPNEIRRTDAFANIQICIEHQGTRKFQLSFSTIRKDVDTKLAMTERFRDIKGSIGVIFDSGYIYQAYSEDAETKTETKSPKYGYRTGSREQGAEISVVVGVGGGDYNELVGRRWTVGGLFYTKGVQQKVITELLRIAKKYSNKEYINPAWINRNSRKIEIIKKQLKYEFPICSGEIIDDGKTIIKKFPVYEIDYDKNTWKVVYSP